MHQKIRFQLENQDEFRVKALHWARQFPYACHLNGNGYNQYPQQPFPTLLAVGMPLAFLQGASVFDILSSKNPADWWFGFLSYDLKNELFDIKSSGENRWHFPLASFFKAEVLIEWKDDSVWISAQDAPAIKTQIDHQTLSTTRHQEKVVIKDFQDKAAYCQEVENIKEGIRAGHVYELNYCRFFECSTALNGLEAYLGLQQISPAPFSSWLKTPEVEIASASPERYLKKMGSQLISQPIKGTAPRYSDSELDKESAYDLLHSEKERAENLMIVDLVRNDLARVSVPGSTQVPELFGIYSFPQVHQMISTVTSDLHPDKTWLDAIRSSFPMGSMTGAPKLEVMNWIDQLETQQRGPFSGALGYIGPGNDFDFNVLIRSIFINHQLGKTGFAVGSAITIDAEPEAEWAECENKALAIRKWLGNI